MVELIINGKNVELKRNGSGIKYNMQIADVFDIASVSSSYTNSFSIPKTPNNTKIFEQLGLVGDTSSIPYTRVPVILKSNGFDIIPTGWLSVMNTSDEYKVNIINGMIDFFKDIENKTMGKDLDLTVFDHEKNISTVIASFSNEYYKYIIADYNGKNIGILPDDIFGINIDYLVPCFSVKKLWDIIFNTFEYTYNETDLEFINGLYITYPKPPQENAEPELLAEANKGNFNTQSFINWNGYKYAPSTEFWTSVVTGSFTNNWTYEITETGSYVFEVTTEAYARYMRMVSIPGFGNAPEYVNAPAFVSIVINGEIENTISTNALTPVTMNYTTPLNAGDVVQVRILVDPVLNVSSGNPYNIYELRHNSTNFKIYGVNLGDVSLTNAFKDFSIKEFIKEILWRTALTPVIDSYTNHIDFVPLSYRLDFNNAIDWSDKYVKRVDESYTISSYAQSNVFKLKHNNEDDLRGDGYLYVNNRNLEDEKIIVNSKIYAPEPLGFEFESVSGATKINTDLYRVWEREAGTNSQNEIVINYKGLSNRFYFLRLNTANATGTDVFRLVSEELQAYDDVQSLPYATNEETLFDELVFKNYKEYEGILYNVRVHKIQLAITESDILTLDMTKPYYFIQEGQYYLLNKLPYEEGKITVGEFIRINKL